MNLSFITSRSDFVVCEQQRRRPTCASTQPDQCLFVRCMERLGAKLASCKMFIIELVSVAEYSGLSLL